MLECSDNNQDWVDFVGLATGTFEASSTSFKTRLDNYTFHFLDNFTKRSGLVESFDCGTFEQRVQVVSSFLETEGHMAKLTIFDSTTPGYIDSATHPKPLLAPELPDPLVIQTHQILLDVKEIVTVKPRNRVVVLEWSTILEQTCMQFFSPRNLRRFLELYRQIWHPNVNFVHRPTFEAANSKSVLVAAMALIGASVSPNKVENDPFLWIYLLDHAFVIFNNLPSRMVIKEMSMHMTFPEAVFQATTATECAQEMHNWHLRSAPIQNLTFREVVESFCRNSITENTRRCFSDLGPLNLFAVVSAFHALIFQHQNSFGGHDQLQAVRNGLNNWKSVWETYSDELPFSPPHDMVDRNNLSSDQLWKRVGFIRHSLEYWLLAKLLVDRLAISDGLILSSDPATIDAGGATHEPILTRYDQTSMLQVNDLIAGFQNVHID